MIQVTVRLVGAKETAQAVGEYGEGVKLLLSQFAWKTLNDAKAILEVYPSVPSRIRSFVSQRIGQRGKRYVATSAGPKRRDQRTGLLGSRWKVVEVGNDGWRLSNDASRKGRAYAVYVHGDSTGERQAWMHVGRWKLMRPVVDNAIPANRQQLQAALANLARERKLAA